MKQLLYFFLSIFVLTSCAPAEKPVVAEPLTELSPTPTISPFIDPVSTLLHPSPTATQLPLTPTATHNPCDPLGVDFCVTEGYFIFQNPIYPPDNTFVDTSYRYGTTQNGARDPHHGVEFLNKFGTPVHAAGGGVVQFAGPDDDRVYSPWKDFYGNVVVIQHTDGVYTLYAHLSKINVATGDDVESGDQIGEVGQSGVATGSHLHFEVRKGGDGTDYFSTQNPELWLIPNNDEMDSPLGAIAFSILDANFNFQLAEFTARYHQDKNDLNITTHYVVTYVKDMMSGEENAALGDLLPGYYRLALKHNGRLYERWVEVESGKLTKVIFVVK